MINFREFFGGGARVEEDPALKRQKAMEALEGFLTEYAGLGRENQRTG